MANEWQHIPQTCPLCADMFTPATKPVSYDDCITHLLAKVRELEGRLQQIEWQNKPLGPQPIPEVPDMKLVDALVEDIKKHGGF